MIYTSSLNYSIYLFICLKCFIFKNLLAIKLQDVGHHILLIYKSGDLKIFSLIYFVLGACHVVDIEATGQGRWLSHTVILPVLKNRHIF